MLASIREQLQPYRLIDGGGCPPQEQHASQRESADGACVLCQSSACLFPQPAAGRPCALRANRTARATRPPSRDWRSAESLVRILFNSGPSSPTRLSAPAIIASIIYR